MRRLVLVVLPLLAACRIALESEMTYEQPLKIDGGTNCVKGTSGVCKCVMATNQPCMDAVGHTDFNFINVSILNTNCTGTSCHQADSSSDAKKNPYGDAATSYASLVNFASMVTPGQTLVVPGHPEKSYALVMLNYLAAEDLQPSTIYPKSDVGLMPQKNPSLCCQKLDVINAWIAAGALNN